MQLREGVGGFSGWALPIRALSYFLSLRVLVGSWRCRGVVVLNIDESSKPESFPVDGWFFCHIDIGNPSIFSESLPQCRLAQSRWKFSEEEGRDDVLSSLLLRVVSPVCRLPSIVVVVAMVVFCCGLRVVVGWEEINKMKIMFRDN
ncbi:hypothetical protein Tco_1422683 [Tanacetum coccineum]